MNIRISALTIMLAASSLLALGCGGGPKLPDTVSIQGEAKFKGKPIDKATVSFTSLSGGLPPEHRYFKTTSDSDGKYSIPKIYPGEYVVQIFKMPDTPAAEGTANPVSAMPGLEKYGNDSTLRANVTPEETTFDFHLK